MLTTWSSPPNPVTTFPASHVGLNDAWRIPDPGECLLLPQCPSCPLATKISLSSTTKSWLALRKSPPLPSNHCTVFPTTQIVRSTPSTVSITTEKRPLRRIDCSHRLGRLRPPTVRLSFALPVCSDIQPRPSSSLRVAFFSASTTTTLSPASTWPAHPNKQSSVPHTAGAQAATAYSRSCSAGPTTTAAAKHVWRNAGTASVPDG